MSQVYLIFFILIIAFSFVNCDSSNTIDESGEQQLETKNNEGKSEEKVVSEMTEKENEAPVYANDSLNTYVSSILKLDKERKDYYYMRHASIKSASGEVYFLNGKVIKTTFPDLKIGVNGTYNCYYDENENLVVIGAYDHANTWYREEYFVLKNETLFDDTYNGEYTDKEIKRDFKFKKTENSWMDKNLFDQTKRRAMFLKEDAIYNQLTYSGTRYYQGFIGGKHKIHMRLNEFKNSGHGEYHYDKVSKSIKLTAKMEEDSIVITEEYNDSITGVFMGVKQEDFSIEGHWMNPDRSKKLYFILSPSRNYITTDGRELKSINITPEEIEIYGDQMFRTD